MSPIAHSGRGGADVRSDCWIELELLERGGISIELRSRVETLYGRSIRELAERVLEHFSIADARLAIDDAGALPFVIAARIEAAVRRLRPEETREFPPPARKGFEDPPVRERLRRSRLYLPGNEPKFFLNAGLHNPDGVILDLEDSVALQVKDEARLLVRNALRAVDFRGAEPMVRINQLPRGLEDLDAVVPQNAHVILIPKCESAEQVREIDARIDAVRSARGMRRELWLMPIVESALGALRAFEIACASGRVVALAVGLEDYTADIGAQRTLEGKESFWMRSQVVNAARAAGVHPIDTVFSDVEDMAGLRASVLEAKALGFDGKGCIHPRQIAVVHDAFAPDPAEIARARNIVRAFDRAQAEGLAAVSLGSKMIDPPVVKRALRTIELAIRTGRLKPGWKEEDNA